MTTAGFRKLGPLAVLVLLLATAIGAGAAPIRPVDLKEGNAVSFAAMIDELARADIVLVGERHNDFAHHRAQQEVITALLGRGPVAVGMESFPNRRNPVLEGWRQGETGSFLAFLEEVGWYQGWGVDPALYRPILETVRRHRLPLVGINIPRSQIRTIARKGMSALPEKARERIGPVAEPAEAYREALRESLASHDGEGDPAGFIRAQTAWDAAMASALLQAREAHPDAVVVGLVGMGHLRGGYGIPHQLRARAEDLVVRTVLPYDPAEEDRPEAGPAGFAWAMAGDVAPEPVRLGVALGPSGDNKGIKVKNVMEGTSAARAGVQAGDRILAVDGLAVRSQTVLIHAIRQHRWGGCLRLKIRRDGERRVMAVPLRRQPEEGSG